MTLISGTAWPNFFDSRMAEVIQLTMKVRSMKVKKMRLALLGVLGLLLLLPSALVGPFVMAEEELGTKQGWMVWGEEYWPTKPVRGGHFRSASRFYIGVMNPNHFPVLDWVSISNLYERLILCDSSYKPTVPWLAESWKQLDQVTVIMKLRKGVRFHDGSAFDAKSLKYQIDWIMDTKNGAWTRVWLEPLKSIEVVDEHTVKWHFKRPWGSFLGTMSSVPGFVLSAKALKGDVALAEAKRLARRVKGAEREAAKAEKNAQEMASKLGKETAKARAEAEEARKKATDIESRIKELATLTTGVKPLDTNPVGTGPYMLEKASPGNYIKLKRNPNWWFGKTVGFPDMPYFDGIKVSVIPDPSVRLANLKAGKIDFVVISPHQYRLVKNDPNLDVAVFPVNWLIFLMFNHAQGPCKDIRVRKAISHAIDRKALIAGIQFGMGRVASCIYPDDHWAHNSDLKPVSYDPELSRKLLAEAGYSDGMTLKGFTGNFPEARAFSKAIMAMLEKVGITWKPNFLSVSGMADPLERLDFDMVGALYPWITEPDHIATILYHPDGLLNNGRSRNEKAITLIKAGREEIDYEKRRNIYHQLEEVLYNNYEDVWLFWPMAVVAFNKNLQGFRPEMTQKYGEAYFFSHPMWFKDGRSN